MMDFWTLSADDKKRPMPLRMEMAVYYYDPGWSVLYAEVDGACSYMPVRGRSLPIKNGQKVLVEGSVIQSFGFDGDLVKVTVLAEGALPEPVRTAGLLNDIAAIRARWAEIEGYVLSQGEPDSTHVEAKLLSENHLVDVEIQIRGTDPVPLLTGARVRVVGVFDSVADAGGGAQKAQLWTAERVQVLGWLVDDPRFKEPATPIDQLEAAASQPWVRLIGEVWRQEPGRTLTLRDDTGQIVLGTVQPQVLAQRTRVEVVGRPIREGFGWTLQDPIFRQVELAPDAPRPGKGLQRLRLAEQVAVLTPEEANRHQAVSLRGVVTWFDDRASYFYLEDTSGGVRVRRAPEAGNTLAPGVSIELSGTTMSTGGRAEVEFGGAASIGPLGQPPVRGITLEQALAGAEEHRRVEMRGYVRQVRTEGNWTRLELTAASGEFSAILAAGESLDYLRGAMVRVQGVCTLATNANRETSEVEVWLQGVHAVVVEEPPPRDPFSVPAYTTGNLRRLSPAQLAGQQVRVSGMVLLHEPGRFLYLQDREGGLLILSRNTSAVRPGTWIDVVGIPGHAGHRAVLREGIWRTAQQPNDAIVPRELALTKLLDAGADIQLVRMTAGLRQIVRDGDRLRLELEAGGTVFGANLPVAANWVSPALGSRLELTGVYVLEYDEYRKPHGFRLELRSPADVRVLAMPPWWTGRRIGYAVVGLGLLTVLAAAWVLALRRRVERQTEQIRAQLEKEARLQAELERSSRLESLGVLAGGIAHDFNNLLTAILGNLGLASMDKHAMKAVGDCIGEAERGARRAKDITQQLLTFAKGGDPVRTSVYLPDVVKEAAGFARHGSNVRFDLDCRCNLPPGDVDAGQISRVVHNLVLNAAQAMPEGGVVRIGLTAVTVALGDVGVLPAGTYLKLTVADSGKGIAPENLSRIFDPYFSTKSQGGNCGLGLATVRSIVKKHNGHIDVESRLGEGTTFAIWLPAAAQPKVTRVATAPASPNGRGPARVLVMDDEDVIRRVAGRMLSLAGHETVFAADGAEAIQAYATARDSAHGFDLVIFDLTVPGGMGGKDALAELIKLDPSIRAVASSGYSSDPVMANPRTYGFCATLPKPYDIPDLMRAVEDARRK